MQMLRELWKRLRGTWRAREIDAEMEEEMRFHLEERARLELRSGVSAPEARRRAAVQFGSVERFMEEARDEQRSRLMEDLLADLRYAWRTLVKTPAFTLVALLSLALGIGANTAIFSVVESVLLRTLPYPDPEQVIDLGLQIQGNEQPVNISVVDFNALKQAETLEAVGAYYSLPGGISYLGSAGPMAVPAAVVTSGVFRALGVTPLLGRLPTAEEDQLGANSVVVLSYRAWQELFGGARDVLGRSMSLGSQPHAVIGVMPEDFRIGSHAQNEIWPVLQVRTPQARAPFWLNAVGRLKDDATLESTAAELRTIGARVLQQYPRSTNVWHYAATPLKDRMIGKSARTVWVLFGAVALVLLIAIANVANLLLARATTRVKEMALRTALGAGRGRLARQLLTESALLSLAGAAFGVAIAYGILRLLPLFAPGDVARLDAAGLNLSVLGFTLALALCAALTIGLAPALRLPRAIAVELYEGGRGGTAGGRKAHLRSTAVVFEFALALTILIGAALVVGSLRQLQAVDTGVNAERVITAQVVLPAARYREEEQRIAVYDRLLEQVRAIPGVQAAALTMGLPPAQLVMRNPVVVDGAMPDPGAEVPSMPQLLVTPDFFSALGIRLQQGRLFTSKDHGSSAPVMIVNESFVRRFFGGRDAIGHFVQTGQPDPGNPRVTVIGVVADVHYAGVDLPVEPTMYVPYAQSGWWNAMSLVVRTAGDTDGLVSQLQRALTAVDPELPLREVKTLEQLHSSALAGPRFRGLLLGSFALLALLLATAGIYGIVSYDVNQRRRETAIRMAIGATSSDVLREVLAAGARITAIGVVLGILGAIATTRLLQSLLFQVKPTDPVTFAAMTALLCAVAMTACTVPALRAARTDPQSALKAE